MHLNSVLDNITIIKKDDKSDLLGSIEQLYLQLQQTYDELKKISVPDSYKNVKNIVLNGMGGSRLGGRVIQRLYENEINIPMHLVGSYNLPAFVNSKTLVILSSYSGNTEEIIATINEAQNKKAKILVFAQSGKLAEIAKENNYPGYYFFKPKYNPCNQPRMSLGYQLLGILLLLNKCDLINIAEKEIIVLINFIRQNSNLYNIGIKQKNNLAKQISSRCHNKIPVIIGAEFIMGSIHAFRNQVNENAKQLCYNFEIPELNHHLLEGLKFPKSNTNNLHFIFIESNLFHPKNIKRILVTKKVLQQKKLDYSIIKLNGKNKLIQAYETIQIGSYIGFYLAMLNKIDPSPIYWVDFFKKELKKI